LYFVISIINCFDIQKQKIKTVSFLSHYNSEQVDKKLAKKTLLEIFRNEDFGLDFRAFVGYRSNIGQIFGKEKCIDKVVGM
jgi:hypothetical protein